MIKGLFYNTGSNLVAFFVSVSVTFIMAPIYLSNMGHYDYGLREMVMAFAGYMGMLDLGLRPTISRFASMHNARKDSEGLLAVYASSLVFLGVVGLVLAMVFFLWAAIFPNTLLPDGDTGSIDKYRLFLLLVGIQLIFAFPNRVAVSYLEGLQRYYIKNIINIFLGVSVASLSYLFITPQNALILLTGLVASQSVVKLFVFSAILMRPAMGAIKPKLSSFSWPKLKEMLSFGLKSFVQGAASKIETASDRIVIGAIVGPAAVPLYTIPATLVGYINSITMHLTHVFMPLFSDLQARGEHRRIQRIYLSTSKTVVGLLLAMAVGITLVGGAFIDVWMAGQFDRSQVDMIIFLLALYFTIPKLNPLASRYLTAIGQHGIFARVSPILALANLGLSILLVIKLGVVGAALGSVFPVCVALPIFLHYSCKHLGLSVMRYVKVSIVPGVLPAGIMGITVIWFKIQIGLDSYSQILACIAMGGLVYSLFFWLLSLDADERNLLAGLIKRA